MSTLPQNAEQSASSPAAAKRASVRCLVVHDDLELRLRLGSLIRRAVPAFDADCISSASFDALPTDRLAAYRALFLIVEFKPRDPNVEPLARVVRSRGKAPHLPIFVFARGGEERDAARSIKLGADDYWPIHSVAIEDLVDVLRPLVEFTPSMDSPAHTSVDAWGHPQIAGYHLVKTIAESAATAIYLASNDDLPQAVALKVQTFKGHYEVSDADRQRFGRECRILSSLNHRSIADLLDFGITDDYLYIASEYFPCGNLRDRLKNPVNEAEAVNYARQIGEALQVLHTAHIVHRDLKPSNLMLTDDNHVVLADFSSTSMRIAPSDSSPMDLYSGTPCYVYPEEVDNREPDGRVDLYSLGIVLYEMLVGSLPYVGDNLKEIYAAHRSAAVPRLPKRVLRFQPVIDRLLAKDLADRYPSATSFLEDLNAAAALRRPAVEGAGHNGAVSS